jgi:glycosyltransferase involved in cell wall biosynthesis
MTDPRRQILFLIPSLRGGGAERVIVTLLRYLDRTKFRLALAVVDSRGAAYREDVPEDVEFIDLRCSRVRYALLKIITLIWRRRPTVVFSTLGHLNLALAMIHPLLPNGVRYVARESCVVSEILHQYPKPEWWRWAYRRFYQRFDMVVCQSQDMRNDLVKNFNFPSAKAVVIHNPVDLERIQRLAQEPLATGLENQGDSDARINLVAAGRLSHEKGFDLLIEAVALCGNPRLYLTILGEGPLKKELEQLAQAKGVFDQVRFVGFQKNPYPFFARADAFVLSSRFEGFPNVVLEALACGTPVIATPAPGGVREILEGIESCMLTESVTAEALANSLCCFLDSFKTKEITQLATRFAAYKITSQYEEILCQE